MTNPQPHEHSRPTGRPADDATAGRLPLPIEGDAAQPGEAGADVRSMRLVEILSHELRSPITTIHLGTKVLRDAGRDIPERVRNEVVAAVEEEAERLYRLVEDLLAVARHDHGAAPLPVRPLLIQHWLPDVLSSEVQANPGLRIRLSLPSSLPPVLADDAALAQVVRNLLVNAARYAPDGMPVEIVARAPADGMVELEVLDRGPGVDPEEAERLFEPFYRSEHLAPAGSAAGLGLAAARRLLAAMGGEISAGRREGGGARFALRVPIAAEEDEPED